MTTDLQDTALLDGHAVKYLSRRVPSPESWGSWDDCTKAWTPVRTTLPVARACMELVKYSYKSIEGYSTSCSCKKANWTSIELCKYNCIKCNCAMLILIIQIITAK